MGEVRSEVALRGVHTGSAPPSCVAKCEGCNPCKPVQCAVTPKLQCIPKRVEVRSEVALRGVHTGSAPPSCVAKCE